MRIRLLLLCMAMALAVPLDALAVWSSATTTNNFKVNADSVYTYDWTTKVNSDSLDVSGCEALSAKFDPSTGDTSTDATMELRSCDSTTEGIGSCKPVSFFTAGETTYSGISSPKKYLRVLATAATVGGDTARVSIKCTDDTTTTSAGSGDVLKPTTSADNSVPRMDGTDGGQLQPSNVLISDADAVTGVTALTATGVITAQGFTATGGTAADAGVEFSDTDATLVTKPTPAATGHIKIALAGAVLQAVDSTAAPNTILSRLIFGPNSVAGTGSLGTTDNTLVRTDGVGGSNIQNTPGLTADDSGNLTAPTYMSPTFNSSSGNNVLVQHHATAGVGIIMLEGDDTTSSAGVTNGGFDLKVGNAATLTDSTITTIRVETLGRTSTGASAATSYGVSVRAVSDGSAIDTGTEVCLLEFNSGAFSANLPACIANSVTDYGAVGATNTVAVQDCGTAVTSGHVFDTLCKVP